jgi:alcohol dehydrogenase
MLNPPREFRFTPLETVLSGIGSIRLLRAELERQKLSRAVIVVGQTLRTSRLLDRVKEALGDHVAAVVDCARPHAPFGSIGAAAARIVNERPDCLVAFGGGSAIDTARLALYRIMTGDLVSDGRMHDYSRAPRPAVGPVLPLFTISTTLSMAEFTVGAGMTDEATGRKGAIQDMRFAPKAAVLDPDLTVETPDRLWLSTGIRALDHAVECSHSAMRHDYTAPLQARAIKLLMDHLEPSVSAPGPERLRHREQCQIAGWMAQTGKLNLNFGISHILGHQLGARFHVEHGVCSCITLAPTMRFMADFSPHLFGAIAEGCGVPFDAANPRPGAAQAALKASEFIGSLGLPTQLRQVGVSREQAAEIVPAVLEAIAYAKSLERAVTHEQILSIIDAAA